jgi:hypothetical protein
MNRYSKKLFIYLLVIFLLALFSSIANAGPKTKYYLDSDIDTYGDPDVWVRDTSPPPGYVLDNTDCDDSDPDVNPGMTEVCGDGIDNNCDTQIDEGCSGGMETYYLDSDIDTYGDINNWVEDTSQPPGYVLDSTDCDDSDPDVNPGAEEICGDGIDQDCDGEDPACSAGKGKEYYYRDADIDGYGDPNDMVIQRNQPEGYVNNNVDCDDTDPNVNPGEAEVCGDGIDNNCDTQIDEGCATYTYYLDFDTDTYGDINNWIEDPSPTPPAGYVVDNTDCDDSDINVNPGADEIPDDGIDNNCDGLFEDTYYEDSDTDTYGNSAVSQVATSQPVGYVLDDTDCDDTDININPGAEEICGDGIDQDCDGSDAICYTMFEQTYGGPAWEKGNSTLEADDGGYIITGIEADVSPTPFNSLFIKKTDEFGNELWHNLYTSTVSVGHAEGMSIQKTADDGYIVLGSAGDFDSDIYDMFLLKVDANGVEQWSNSYGTVENQEHGVSLAVMPSGYALLATTELPGGVTVMQLITTDLSGNETSNNTYLIPLTTTEGKQVICTSDGNNLLLLGTVCFGGPGTEETYLVKTDLLGNELVSRPFWCHGEQKGVAIQETTWGNYAVLALIRWSEPGRFLEMTEVEPVFLDDLSHLNVMGPPEMIAKDMKALPDGLFAITGSLPLPGGEEITTLLKCDIDGWVTWEMTYPILGSHNVPENLQLTSDGGFVLTGWMTFFGPEGTDIFLLKTDPVGNTY